MKKGYIYIVRCQDFYKIGKTGCDIKDRKIALQTGNPFPIKLIMATEVEDMDFVEKVLHQIAGANKAHIQQGEWYKLCDDILEFIIRWLIQASDLDNPPFKCGCIWNTKDENSPANIPCEKHQGGCFKI